MPKAKEKSREPKDNGTSKDSAKRAARKPYRYRIDEHSTNSDSDGDSQQLRPDSDDESRHTLEARIRALESMITNRAKSLPSNQPETTMNTDLDTVPSTSQKSSNNRHKKRKSKHARDSRHKHESSTDEQVSSHDKKTTQEEKAEKSRYQHHRQQLGWRPTYKQPQRETQTEIKKSTQKPQTCPPTDFIRVISLIFIIFIFIFIFKSWVLRLLRLRLWFVGPKQWLSSHWFLWHALRA